MTEVQPNDRPWPLAQVGLLRRLGEPTRKIAALIGNVQPYGIIWTFRDQFVRPAQVGHRLGVRAGIEVCQPPVEVGYARYAGRFLSPDQQVVIDDGVRVIALGGVRARAIEVDPRERKQPDRFIIIRNGAVVLTLGLVGTTALT